MTDLIARVTAIATAFLAVVAVAALYVTSRPDVLHGGSAVGAQFEDAYPLLEGMHVRVDGAVAGTVKDIALGDDGNAHVTMQLFEGTKLPRADAIATIRPEDITGDTYVSLTLGQASEPLRNECGEAFAADIPCIGPNDTMNAPRFDDLLNAFTEPVRQGLEILFVQLGRTLEGRGEDVNVAALKLRAGLEAANEALAEVNSQNDALQKLVVDAGRVAEQAADRDAELGNLVSAFAATVNTTAAHLPALDRGLAEAPESIGRARLTLAKLNDTTVAALPLAATLGDAAPHLALTANLLGPFLDDSQVILDEVEPTLDLVTKLLVASLPTLRTNPKRVFTAPFDLTAGLGAVLTTLIGDPTLIDSLFSADCYGGRVPGCDSSDDFGLGAIAVQDGSSAPGYEGNDPERFFIRASAVPSCETFGVPIEPGCLADVLLNLDNVLGLLPFLPLQQRAGGDPNRGGDPGGAGADDGGTGEQGSDATPGGGQPGGPLGPGLNDALDQLGLGDTLGGLGGNGSKPGGGKGPAGAGKQGPKGQANAVDDLLDFLLGP